MNGNTAPPTRDAAAVRPTLKLQRRARPFLSAVARKAQPNPNAPAILDLAILIAAGVEPAPGAGYPTAHGPTAKATPEALDQARRLIAHINAPD